MGRKKTPGLWLRNGIWHTDKVVFGKPIRQSTGTSNFKEAEAFLAHRIEEVRRAKVYGERTARPFRDAAARYLEESLHLATIADMAMHLKQLDSFIGDLGLNQVHDGTLAPFIAERQRIGVKNKTINHALSVVRRVLILSARRWRDEDTGLTWLETPPLITMLPIKGKHLPESQKSSKPYPLSWDEQAQLLQKLPDHLAQMVLYKVNVGGREEEICSLRWDWEQAFPELNTSVFFIPDEVTKNEEPRVHVLNRIARSVIKARRSARPDQHLEKCQSRRSKDCNCTRTFVFGYKGYRVGKMNNNAWKRAWRKAGLPVNDQYKRGVHNLKHTFGRRLRAANVPLETRKVLLGHTNGDITTHYSATELHELIEAVERLCGQLSHKSPTLTLLRPQGSEQEVC